MLRRGFKTEANRIADEIRGELGLKATDPLDPFRLADFLEILVLPISGLRDDCQYVDYFLGEGSSEFSAVTIYDDLKRIIYHNDQHHPYRQNSNLAHEVAHALLHHSPSPALTESGERSHDAAIEEEANWLAGALLISEGAALQIARKKLPISEASHVYKVSEPMIQFRLNVTGAYRRVARKSRY